MGLRSLYIDRKKLSSHTSLTKAKPHTEQHKERIDIGLRSSINKVFPLNLQNTEYSLNNCQQQIRARDSSKNSALPSYPVYLINARSSYFLWQKLEDCTFT